MKVLAVLSFLLFLAQNCANILKKKNSKNLHFFKVKAAWKNDKADEKHPKQTNNYQLALQ
jgi:hypothetical protein